MRASSISARSCEPHRSLAARAGERNILWDLALGDGNLRLLGKISRHARATGSGSRDRRRDCRLVSREREVSRKASRERVFARGRDVGGETSRCRLSRQVGRDAGRSRVGRQVRRDAGRRRLSWQVGRDTSWCGLSWQVRGDAGWDRLSREVSRKTSRERVLSWEWDVGGDASRCRLSGQVGRQARWCRVRGQISWQARREGNVRGETRWEWEVRWDIGRDGKIRREASLRGWYAA